MSEKCRHLHTKGPYIGTRCGEKISKLDPEQRYCAKHRVCVFLIDENLTKSSVEKVPIKYHNYITFCESLVSKPEDLEVVKSMFSN